MYDILFYPVWYITLREKKKDVPNELVGENTKSNNIQKPPSIGSMF